MAYTAGHNNQPAGLSLGARLSALGAAIGAGFVRYAEYRSRSAEIRALEALSDEELAARGLTRDRIVHHVFRDAFFI
ncbi:DUF1127 domain-containing protein [Frigidibacter oleivorans]|uniref:DUF1127 domain-containing protein n=1 Tax=Frigidibacter oleivorans TaxID=2487129 RepID=UPI000F8E57DF|nr:DUF1127 domain-containing protein [Frigidibacter oleivorans]